MTTLTLDQIEKKAKMNATKRKDTIDEVVLNIQSESFIKGRVRPKDPTEAKILSRFTRK